ncbi:MAG: hypothetical protein IT442_04975 [Phycisphaeraceae bacterium]|nr:hypothetical protein [Phycisphaeraceae bacterium]
MDMSQEAIKQIHQYGRDDAKGRIIHQNEKEIVYLQQDGGFEVVGVEAPFRAGRLGTLRAVAEQALLWAKVRPIVQISAAGVQVIADMEDGRARCVLGFERSSTFTWFDELSGDPQEPSVYDCKELTQLLRRALCHKLEVHIQHIKSQETTSTRESTLASINAQIKTDKITLPDPRQIFKVRVFDADFWGDGTPADPENGLYPLPVCVEADVSTGRWAVWVYPEELDKAISWTLDLIRNKVTGLIEQLAPAYGVTAPEGRTLVPGVIPVLRGAW